MKRSTKKRLTRSQRRYRNRHNRRKPVSAYFPTKCSKCNFVADGVDEMENHKHENENFS